MHGVSAIDPGRHSVPPNLSRKTVACAKLCIGCEKFLDLHFEAGDISPVESCPVTCLHERAGACMAAAPASASLPTDPLVGGGGWRN